MKTQEFDCKLLKKDDFTMYEYSALKAYCIIVGKGYSTLKEYEEAWYEALKSKTDKKSNIVKGCPRKAFLGLCEDGYLKDVPDIPNDNSGFNKEYAIEAVNILNNGTIENPTPKKLWDEVLINLNISKSYNQQMHVVLALSKMKLILDKIE